MFSKIYYSLLSSDQNSLTFPRFSDVNHQNSLSFALFSHTNVMKNIHGFHCVKSVRIRSYSGPHFPHLDWKRKDTLSVFSPNVGKCEKNADQNNSEYGLFLSSGFHYIIRTDIWLCCLHSKLKNLHWVGNKYLNHANEVFENFQSPYNWGLLLYKITF